MVAVLDADDSQGMGCGGVERLGWSVVGIRWVEVGQREVTQFKWAGEWVGGAGKKPTKSQSRARFKNKRES